MKTAWREYWFGSATAESLALVRITSFALLFAIYCTLDDRAWTQVSPVLWMPVSLFRLLPGPPRDAALIGILQIVWKISLLTSALGLASRISMLTAAALGFFLLGLPNCFGKIHHLDGFPVLLMAILAVSRCADAIALDRLWRRTPAEPSGQYRWPVRLVQTLFLLIFFAAGLAKLRNGGMAWMTAANMRSIWLGEMLTHVPPTRLGSVLAQSAWISQVAAVATVVIELSALPALFVARLRPFTLAALFALQLLIALMLGVYFTPHLVGYALFVPWQFFYPAGRAIAYAYPDVR